MKNIWLERKNGLIFDFNDDQNGDTNNEKFESLCMLILKTVSYCNIYFDVDVVVGKDVLNLFKDAINHICLNANFNLPSNALHFVGKINRINLYATDYISPNVICIDLLTYWKRITVKGIYDELL